MNPIIQETFSQIRNFPWITAKDLATINAAKKQELERLLRIPEKNKTPIDKEKIQIAQGLNFLDAGFKGVKGSKNFYEAFAECEEIDLVYRMGLWLGYLNESKLFSDEQYVEVIVYGMGIMHGGPVKFAGYLHHILNHSHVAIEQIIDSGLCHQFAQLNASEILTSCYELVRTTPSASPKKISDFIERLDQVNCYGAAERNVVYRDRVLSGKENKEAQKIAINYPKNFDYKEEKLNLYCHHFGLDFLISALQLNKYSASLRNYVQQMDNECLTALCTYSLGAESKIAFYSTLYSYLTIAQKRDMFECLDKWFFCDALGTQNLSREQLDRVLQTPIKKSNVHSASAVLFRDKKIKEVRAELYQASFTCFFESPALFPDFLGNSFANHPEIIRLCKEKTNELEQRFFQILEEACELTQDIFDSFYQEYRNMHPQRQLLNRLSPVDLHLPQGNYEFYAYILYVYYQKNPHLNLETLVERIHQFVLHDGEKKEDIDLAKIRTLYEAFIYISDAGFQQKILERLPSFNWEHTIADKPLSELALARGNHSFFQLRAGFDQERLLEHFDELNEITMKTRFASTLVKQPDLLRYYFSLYPEKKQLKLIDKFFYLHHAAPFVESLIIILELLPAAMRFAAMKKTAWNGRIALYYATINPESLKTLLRLLPEEDRLTAIKEKYDYDQTMLHWAATAPASLNILLALLPKTERLVAMSKKDNSGKTALDGAASNQESLNVLLELLSESDLIAAIKAKYIYSDTMLHWVAQKPVLLKILLGSLSEADRVIAIKAKNNIGTTVLHSVVSKPESLKILLELVPEKTALLAAVKEKDRFGDTVLHSVTSQHESLKLLLASLPDTAEFFAAVKEKNHKGETVLHSAASRPESLKLLLDLFPDKAKLFAAVKEKNHKGKTVLHLAASRPESLKLLLALFSDQTELVAAIKEKNKDGDTVLHLAASNPESLKLLLALFSDQTELVAAIKEKNKDGDTVLHLAASKPQSLKTILELVPEMGLLDVVKEKNNQAATVLHSAALKPELLKLLLALFPDQAELVAAVKEKNKAGNTVLHLAAFEPESLKTILKLVPEIELIEIVKEKNNQAQTVFDKIAMKPESFKILLLLFREGTEQLLAIIKGKNAYGNTVLHRATNVPELFEILLRLLPESDRIATIKEKNIYGETVLHWAASTPGSLKILFDLYPDKTDLSALAKEKSISGNSLHHAISSIGNLKLLLGIIPETERLTLIREKNDERKCILDIDIPLKLFVEILTSLPETDRLAAVKEKNQDGVTILYKIAQSLQPDLIKAILELLPITERLSAIKGSVLHLLATDPVLLKTILTLLPEEDRLEAIKEKDGNGKTVVHLIAASKPELLKTILKLLPVTERFNAIKGKEIYNDSVLHLLSEDLSVLKAILVLLPEADRLDAMKEKNKEGKSVLHQMAVSEPKALKTILELVPVTERILGNIGFFSANNIEPEADSKNTMLAFY